MLSIIERRLLCVRKVYARHVCSSAFRVADDQELVEKKITLSKVQSQKTAEELESSKKCLKIAILGVPNTGKSTLVNQLVKRSLCATSMKIHTTSCKAAAVYTENDTQLIFIDTPGSVDHKEMSLYKLRESFAVDIAKSVQDADVIGFIHSVADISRNSKICPTVLKMLSTVKSNIPILLILNKIDRLKDKSLLLQIAKEFYENKSHPSFDQTFMISALTGSGVNHLRSYLISLAKPNKWLFDPTMYTDQTVETLIEETLRARYLDHLPNEMPYRLQFQVDEVKINDDGGIWAVVRVVCHRSRLVGFALGSNGALVKTVAKESEEILRHALRASVALTIVVTLDQRDTK